MQLTPSPTLSVGGHPPPHPFPAWLHTPRGGVHVAHTVRNALSEEGAGAGGRGPRSSQSEGPASGASTPGPWRSGPPPMQPTEVGGERVV